MPSSRREWHSLVVADRQSPWSPTTILCRRSERRGATVGAGLSEPHFPCRPPGTTGSREDQDVIAIRLHPEDLVTSGHGLARREPEDLPGRSPDLDLLAVIVPKSR